MVYAECASQHNSTLRPVKRALTSIHQTPRVPNNVTVSENQAFFSEIDPALVTGCMHAVMAIRDRWTEAPCGVADALPTQMSRFGPAVRR